MMWWQAALQADTGAQQVSIWVPIVVGVIGAAGIIGGQWINTRREDRRWQREQAREDQRWQREKAREEIRWQRELHREAEALAEANRTHWRDKKFEIFAELFSTVDRWETLISHAVEMAHADKSVPQTVKEDLSKIREECLIYDLQISLLMTNSDARDILDSAITAIESHSMDLTAGRPISESPDVIMTGISEAIVWMRTSIRLDLGIANNKDRGVLRKAGITDRKEDSQ